MTVITTDLLKFEPSNRPVTYVDWLDGRRPLHLSTNAGSDEVAFQSWRNFKEAFAPELIGQAFSETSATLSRPIKSCIDPFGGSGTTALASQFLGVHPTTIEVNPYLADLVEAKLSAYDVELLIEDFLSVINEEDLECDDPFPGAPPTFVEPGQKERYLFERAVASRLAGLRLRILRVENSANRRLMRVLLGSIAIPLSNVVISGKGRRYRRDWKSRTIDPNQVNSMFSDAVIKAIYDIRRYENRAEKSYTILRGDARQLTPSQGGFDLAVFSPPYPNSFDYTDVYNVELWVCGYLTSGIDNRELRTSTIRSHVQINRSFEAPFLESQTLHEVFEQLEEVKSQLWNRHIPSMVRAYFADMCVILERLSGAIVPGGRAYIVIGDSQYAGIQVPVARILKELAMVRGFCLVDEVPFRSMRVSPQQGGRPELLETLLTLSRD